MGGAGGDGIDADQPSERDEIRSSERRSHLELHGDVVDANAAAAVCQGQK